MADPSRPVTGYPAPPSYSQSTAANNPNGVAYPYPPPPQPPYHHNQNYAYPYNSYDASRATFLRRLIVAMIAFFVISASIIFIIWLVLRPRLPKFRVDSFSVTNFNVSSSPPSISGTWAVEFSVYNPNKKMSIAYDEIDSVIFYKSTTLAGTRISPFTQGTRTENAVNATYSATKSFVESRVVSGISADRGGSGGGTVNFNIKVLARVGFRTGRWRLRRRLLRVLCENVGVGLSSNSASGKLVGGARECRVGF